MKIYKLTFKDLADEYLQTDKEQTSNVWDKVSELSSDSAIKLLSTPDLVREYISKYRLYSDSEIKLLSTPDLVREYISKYRLYSDSAEIKLLSTPDLVKEYISKWGINDNIKNIIRNNI